MNRKNGFTLIELLVVMAILSLLISIALPAMSAARRHGTKMTCQTRMHEIARAIWAYSVSNDNRVPYVVSPMVNNKFDKASVPDAEINPYDRERWPLSLQNVLMPIYLGEDEKIFTCPAATVGWPRASGAFRMTFRDAGVNQPNGALNPEASYYRETFGFLDGRSMNELRVHFTGNPVVDSQMRAWLRGGYVRDMVKREGARVTGPHDGGINILNREFGVEWRDNKTIQVDLATSGEGVRF
ncbi:MAG: hypothetical protein DCC65_07275 [Planctomycetota bacterium]|nr:MAG: hypothetical protein DCC65_07275 [Planctomycetota bacterium]